MANRYKDKNTVDQAWNMMRSTLDQEMPVQKKRRAVWWIPVGLGLLTLVSLAYLFYPADTNTDVKPQEKIQTTEEIRPIASQEAKPPNTILNQTENISKKESKSIENKELKTKSTSNPRSSKKNKAKTKTKIAAPLKSKVSNQVSRKEKVILINQMKAAAPAKVFKRKDSEPQIRDQRLTQSSPNENLDSSSNLKADDAVENTSLAEDLAPVVRPSLNLVNPLPILDSQQFEREASTNLEVPAPKIRKWKLALKTAVLSDVKIDSPTLLIEGQVRRKMGSSKWSFVSGLGFKSQNLQFKLDDESSYFTTQDLYADPSGAPIFGVDFNLPGSGANSISEANSSSALRKSTLTFNFLYIPIGLRYNFKGRWSLDAGVHYNFIELSGKSSSTSTLRFGSQHDSRETSEFVSAIRNYSQRNFNHFSYYLSANYRLGKRASLLAQYQGNTNRFVGESPRIGTHQFGLGMKWQF